MSFPEIGERPRRDQALQAASVNARSGRRTEKQIETVPGISDLPHVPEITFDIHDLAQNFKIGFHGFLSR